MPLDLIITAILMAAASGLPGLYLPKRTVCGQAVAVMMMCGSLTLGWMGISLSWGVNPSLSVIFPWPAMGNSIVGIDRLSAFFLVPIFLMGGLGSIYGIGYWPSRRHIASARQLQLFWGLLTAGMALLVISKHAAAFLFGWEVMALSAFFLIAAEDHKNECRQAGWIYLIATHIGTLTLFALFAVWRWATGSYDLKPVADETISLCVMNVLFFLSLLGFGIKAGLMPFHFWLPDAHANAPSHVSAMLSGVVLKMGIYGLVRFLSLMPNPPYLWGALIVLLGAISGLIGVVFAIGQHDLKRLLAYHSVENIGIILMGLGLALLGRSADQPQWIVLGLAGCLLHVWNHSLFKSLLFLSAGSVVHNVQTRNIDALGGLAKTMPWTAAMFAVGAVSICGLPPLNGFVSELFIYIGLFGAAIKGESLVSVMAVPVLAMIGALALACFVKVYGAVFLGTGRTKIPASTHESPLTMRLPMMVLAGGCVVIGLMPVLLPPILDGAIADWLIEPNSAITSIGIVAPLKALSSMSVLLVVLAGLTAAVIRLRGPLSRCVNTWDCGYARPTGRMQYTASSFSHTIVEFFHGVLHPHIHRPSVEGLFPKPARTSSHVNEIILDRLLIPFSRKCTKWFGWFRRFQQGITQQYLLYVLVTVILLMTTIIPFKDFMARLFAR